MDTPWPSDRAKKTMFGKIVYTQLSGQQEGDRVGQSGAVQWKQHMRGGLAPGGALQGLEHT